MSTEQTGPSVPNWIAKAVIVTPSRFGHAALTTTPIKSWRATKTQVVVETENGRERRFYLDGLVEVGSPKAHPMLYPHLAPPDSKEVVAGERGRKMTDARHLVLGAIERVRLQDSTEDLDLVLTKLEAVRQAVLQAQASLAHLS